MCSDFGAIMLSSAFMQRVLVREDIRRWLLLCALPALVFFVGTVVVQSAAGFSLVEILRDPAQTAKHSSFLGFVSSIGTWFWVAAASICMFRVTTFEQPDPGRHRKLLVLSGWFSFWLAIDDFFLVHDRYIAEGFLIPLYAIFVITLLVRHRGTILGIDGFAFMVAGAMLAMSVVVDAVQEILPMPYGYSQVLEEGFKFIGAASWLHFCYRIAAYRSEYVATDEVLPPA